MPNAKKYDTIEYLEMGHRPEDWLGSTWDTVKEQVIIELKEHREMAKYLGHSGKMPDPEDHQNWFRARLSEGYIREHQLRDDVLRLKGQLVRLKQLALQLFPELQPPVADDTDV